MCIQLVGSRNAQLVRHARTQTRISKTTAVHQRHTTHIHIQREKNNTPKDIQNKYRHGIIPEISRTNINTGGIFQIEGAGVGRRMPYPSSRAPRRAGDAGESTTPISPPPRRRSIVTIEKASFPIQNKIKCLQTFLPVTTHGPMSEGLLPVVNRSLMWCGDLR